MKTIVISGGTDGMGKALGLEYLERGDTVVAIGSNAGKGADFLTAAAQLGAADRAHFIGADLSLMSENRRVLTQLTAQFPVVDALVLAARYYRSTRHETAEGLEASFALFYMSRFMLSHGLATALAKAENPVVMDLAGPGGDLDKIRWDDLQFANGYDPDAVMHQCGKLSDLLGVRFAAAHGGSGIRYVLLHPGLTRTGFTGEYSAADQVLVEGMLKRAQPIEAGIARIIRHLDNPSAKAFCAYMQDNEVEVSGKPFDAEAADRLYRLTTALLDA